MNLLDHPLGERAPGPGRWSWWGISGPLITVLCGAAPAAAVVVLFGVRVPFPIVLLAVISVLTLSALYASLRLCGWYPTRSCDLERIRTLAGLGPGDVFVDLGCGDGRVVAFLSRTTGARCVGVELSIFHFALAWLRKLFSGLPNMELRFGDFYSQDLGETDVAYLYGIPPAMGEERLQSVLRTMPEGARLICYHFGLADETPDRVDDGGGFPIYLYRIRKADALTSAGPGS